MRIAQIQERIGNGLLVTVATCAMLFLYIPVLVLIIFSFNDNRSLVLPLRGFTLKWYEAFLQNSDMLEAIGNSLYVATVATAVTIVIGTIAAFGLDRVAFPGKPVATSITEPTFTAWWFLPESSEARVGEQSAVV